MDEQHSAAPHPLAPYTERTSCRACGSAKLTFILSLGDQYLANFVRERDDSLPRCPLELVQCDECGLLQLRHSIDGDLMWREYWYRSSVNQTMRDALADVVRDATRIVREGRWLDIGANDGYLLSRVPSHFTRVGCEPARNLLPELGEQADHVILDYFGADPAMEFGPYDVITSCAMFYDLDDPDRFVEDIALSLASDGVWVNQLSDAPTMLKRNAFDSICHEHRCYYDVPSLKTMYRRHGLHIIGLSFNDVNGGSVRVTAAKQPARDDPTVGTPRAGAYEVEVFARRVRRWKDWMSEMVLLAQERHGPLWALGASTKGCCTLQYLGLSDAFIGIADRNPAKVGLMMAGTWIPVTDEAALRRAAPPIVVPLIWAFRHEILDRERYLREIGSAFLFPLPNPELVL